jgi:hypothetical protein
MRRFQALSARSFQRIRHAVPVALVRAQLETVTRT